MVRLTGSQGKTQRQARIDSKAKWKRFEGRLEKNHRQARKDSKAG